MADQNPQTGAPPGSGSGPPYAAILAAVGGLTLSAALWPLTDPGFHRLSVMVLTLLGTGIAALLARKPTRRNIRIATISSVLIMAIVAALVAFPPPQDPSKELEIAVAVRRDNTNYIIPESAPIDTFPLPAAPEDPALMAWLGTHAKPVSGSFELTLTNTSSSRSLAVTSFQPRESAPEEPIRGVHFTIGGRGEFQESGYIRCQSPGKKACSLFDQKGQPKGQGYRFKPSESLTLLGTMEYNDQAPHAGTLEVALVQDGITVTKPISDANNGPLWWHRFPTLKAQITYDYASQSLVCITPAQERVTLREALDGRCEP